MAVPESSINSLICALIKKRAIVQFYYDGGTRIVEPYCHGISSAGNKVLRGFQIGGHSASGEPIRWKLFEVAKMSDLQETGRRFTTLRPGYEPNDRGMTSVHCSV